MNKGYVIFSIIQSALLIVVLAIAIIGINKPLQELERIDYNRIIEDNKKVIHDLKQDIIIVKAETQLVIHKVDSMKAILPKYENNLISIKTELKTLNDAKISNYTDSTAAAILRRLSR